MAEMNVAHVGRRAVIGAVIGAALGVVAGLLIHWIVSADGSLAWYELIGAVCGLVFGAIVGAFYGGAFALPRRRR